MTHDDLIERIQHLVSKKAYRVNDLLARGSVRDTGYLLMGLGAETDFNSFSNGQHPWDQHFATAKIMEIFDDSPGAISSTLLISYLESETFTESQYRSVRETMHCLNSAGVSKVIDRYDEIRNKKHGVPKSDLSSIMLVIDIYKIQQDIRIHGIVYLRDLAVRTDMDKRALRTYSLNYALYGKDAHPVIRDVHHALLNQLRVLRNEDKDLNDVA